MKRLAVLVILFGALSYAVIFAETGSKTHSATQKILKPLIELQCGSELKSSKLWQASSFFWSEEQQNKAQKKICGCVSDNALNDVPTKDLVLATINENAKNKLIQQAVMNSIKGCAQEALR